VRVGWSDGQQSLHSKGGVTSSSEVLPIVEEEAPFQNTQKSGKNTNMVMGTNGPETMNDCAGEHQWQFTGLESRRPVLGELAHDSQNRETVPYGHEYRGTRN
jgi:hypothetical protein